MADGAAGIVLNYWQPDPALARFVSGYHVYTLGLPPQERIDDVFFPGWTNVRFTFEADPWRVRIGRRLFDPVPVSALFGPTSHAAYSNSGSGRLVGAGLTPVGWKLVFGRSALRYANRVTDLESLWGGRAAALRRALASTDDPAPVFDSFFHEAIARAGPPDPLVERVFAMITDPAVTAAADLAERVGVNGRALARLSQSHFGFTPKLLLRRARFVRALIDIQHFERGHWSEAVALAGYHDQSHFTRDCRLFLGMPLSQFMALPKPLNEASARLRATILGAPAQALHRPPERNIPQPA